VKSVNLTTSMHSGFALLEVRYRSRGIVVKNASNHQTNCGFWDEAKRGGAEERRGLNRKGAKVAKGSKAGKMEVFGGGMGGCLDASDGGGFMAFFLPLRHRGEDEVTEERRV